MWVCLFADHGYFGYRALHVQPLAGHQVVDVRRHGPALVPFDEQVHVALRICGSRQHPLGQLSCRLVSRSGASLSPSWLIGVYGLTTGFSSPAGWNLVKMALAVFRPDTMSGSGSLNRKRLVLWLTFSNLVEQEADEVLLAPGECLLDLGARQPLP